MAITSTDERKVGIGDNRPPEAAAIEILVPEAEILTVIKDDVAKSKERCARVLDTYTRIPSEISDDEQYERVVAVIAEMRTADDERDTRRKAHKSPYQKVATAIDNAFKLEAEGEGKKRTLSKEVDAAVVNLTKRLSAYDTKKLEAEEKRRTEESNRLAESARNDGIEIDTSVATEVRLGNVKARHGGVSQRSVIQTWSVANEAEIPRSLLSVDPKKVEAMIGAGAESIPGITITRTVLTTVKRR